MQLDKKTVSPKELQDVVGITYVKLEYCLLALLAHTVKYIIAFLAFRSAS